MVCPESWIRLAGESPVPVGTGAPGSRPRFVRLLTEVGRRVWDRKELNPILRGWGNYFRTGNAAIKFRQIDWYVVGRLRGLQVKKRGRNLRPGQADQWTEQWFNDHGLHRLRGTIRYPQAA